MSKPDGMNSAAPITPMRLAPDMASLRLQVLAFVRVYAGRWAEGPSYGEIGEGTGASRTAIKKAVRRLITQGLLLRAPGERGLMLPDRREDALRVLRDLGWTVDAEAQRLIPPSSQGVTIRALMAGDVLDYDGSVCSAMTGGVNGTKEGSKSRDKDPRA